MRANIRFAVAVLAGTLIATAGLWGPGAAGAGAQGANAVLNQPSYYEGQGYGSCTKTENPGDPYTLGQPPTGSHWSLLVLKAGSEASNSDWNTEVENPVPGPYVHPSGKDLSHVIVCTQSGAPPTTTTPPTTTVPGGDCGEYTPTQVTVAPPSVLPGESFTISGTAVPGDTITATLTDPDTGPVPLGSDEVDEDGQFSITATAPELEPGTYTITLSSDECPVDIQVTIVIYALTFSGCGNSNATRTFKAGQTIGWEPQTASFLTSEPIRMRLVGSGGFSQVLYNGAWPANNKISLTIPATAPAGKYTMEQRSTRVNGKVMTRTCPVWVEQSGVSGGSTQLAGSVPISGSGTAAPWAAAGLAAMAGLVLFRLRSRRSVQEA